MKNFMQDVGSYVMHYMVFYLVSCLILAPLFMVISLVVMTVLHYAFGVEVGGGDEGNLLGGVGIGLSLAFVISWPIALAGTIWAAPNDRNLKRDYEKWNRMMGPRQPGPAGREQMEEFS